MFLTKNGRGVSGIVLPPVPTARERFGLKSLRIMSEKFPVQSLPAVKMSRIPSISGIRPAIPPQRSGFPKRNSTVLCRGRRAL